MKKRILKILVVFLIIVILQQLYWAIGLSGNLSIFVSNKSSQELAKIEVSLDGENIVEEDFNNTFFYKRYSFGVTPWKHEITVYSNDRKVKKSVSFHNVFVTRVIIEMIDNPGTYEDEVDFDIYTEYVWKKLSLN